MYEAPSIIPLLSTKLVVLTARFLKLGDHEIIHAAERAVKAARALERGERISYEFDFELQCWAHRLRLRGDELGAREADKVRSLAALWVARRGCDAGRQAHE